jgi:hypothetical protein
LFGDDKKSIFLFIKKQQINNNNFLLSYYLFPVNDIYLWKLDKRTPPKIKTL